MELFTAGIAFQDVKDLLGLLVTALICFCLFIFRKEISNLIGWIVSFTRVSKTKEGYELSKGGSEPDANNDEAIDTMAKQEVALSEDAPDGELLEKQRENWIDALQEKRYDDAISLLEQEAEKTSDINKQVTLRCLIAHVEFLKDESNGIAAFRDLINNHGTSPSPYYWFALSYMDNEQYDEAINILIEGETKVQNPVQLVSSRVTCLERLGRDSEARQVLEEAIQEYPRNPAFYNTLAEKYHDMEDEESAIHWYRIGIAECAKNDWLLSRYASFLVKTGEDEEALLRYKKLVSLDSQNATYWTLLGNAYLALELYDNALEAYIKADKLANSTEGWILANIGNIYNRRGFYSRAVTYLKQALELQPESQYAHERLAQAMTFQDKEKSREEEILSNTSKKLTAGSTENIASTSNEQTA